MSSSPENAAEHTTTPVSNLTYLHKQQRKGSRLQDTSHARGRNTSRYELGRRNRAGEKVTRIYPREVYVAPQPVSQAASHDQRESARRDSCLSLKHY